MKQFNRFLFTILLSFIVFSIGYSQNFVVSNQHSSGTSPQSPEGLVTVNYDGDNAGGVGDGGTTFIGGAKFRAEIMSPYTGGELQFVQFYYYQAANGLTIMIYDAGSATEPGALLLEQPLDLGSLTVDAWNEVALTTNIPISGNDLWVCLQVEADPGQVFPFGVDAGPADPDGDYVNDAGTWDHLAGFGLDYNWNIRGVIETNPVVEPLVIDFETVGNDWTWNLFDAGTGGGFDIVANPDPGGLNTSDSCAMLTIGADGQPWAGVWCSDFPDMVIDTTNCVVKVLVYKDVISNFNVKLEPPAVDHNVPNGVTNQWQELTFDYSSDVGDTSVTLTIIPDFPDSRDYASVNYFDNIRFLPYSQLPVELTSFSVSTNVSGQVVLNWQTATEINNRIFEIERKTGEENYSTIGFVQGQGTSSQQHSYTFIDKNVGSQTYTYRLKQIDFDGSTTYSKAVEITVTGPKVFDLAQNYPNPFNPTTSISYVVPNSGFVTLAVYNTLGEQVALLVNGVVSAGSHTATFDAKSLPSGAYVYKLQQGNSVLTKKMLLMK